MAILIIYIRQIAIITLTFRRPCIQIIFSAAMANKLSESSGTSYWNKKEDLVKFLESASLFYNIISVKKCPYSFLVPGTCSETVFLSLFCT